MAVTNFLVTAAVLGSAAFLLTGDVRRGASNLRRNVRNIRVWLEEAEQSQSQSQRSSQRYVPDGSDNANSQADNNADARTQQSHQHADRQDHRKE